ncbi:MAG TPA: tetratricopeptide repeat protein, partial [Chromatiaceae bacterium]|nr:tetratricopeptide repeat protein [Chromatiaceae bacterium]
MEVQAQNRGGQAGFAPRHSGHRIQACEGGVMRIVPALLLLLLVSPVGMAGGTLSERTYKRLAVIQALMGEERYDEALERLAPLAASVKRNHYEYAMVMQTYGYAYAARNRYREAISAFEQSLATETLPDQVQQAMRYDLAQLYAAIPDWQAAARAYEQWLAGAEKPSAQSYAFGATIYAQLKQYGKAIPKIKKAISLAPKPRESWYQLLLAMYYQRQNYSSSANVLQSMVAFWPDKAQYWKQLSGVYFTLEQNHKSLAVLALAYRKGLLDSEHELMNLVNLYLLQNIPYKAATILEREMDAGRIEKSGKNLQKLGEAWMSARE